MKKIIIVGIILFTLLYIGNEVRDFLLVDKIETNQGVYVQKDNAFFVSLTAIMFGLFAFVFAGASIYFVVRNAGTRTEYYITNSERVMINANTESKRLEEERCKSYLTD